MRKRCIALLLCLLTLAALTGCGESSAKAVTSNGVECYRVDGVCYPAVFGEPQLTGEEITALLDSGDTAEMAATVSTVPDALRLLKARQQDSEDIDSQDVETTLLRGSSQPRGWVDALLYLLLYVFGFAFTFYPLTRWCKANEGFSWPWPHVKSEKKRIRELRKEQEQQKKK